MTALDRILQKANRTKFSCGVTRLGTGRGYESRTPIEVFAYPDLRFLAQEIERLRARIDVLEDEIRWA